MCFTGATYVYESPKKWPKMVKSLKKMMPVVRNTFEMKHVPLFWSMDFIRDWNEDGMRLVNF